MGYSYCCGSPWKSLVRSIFHNRIPLHNWTLSHSHTVSQQRSYVARLTTMIFSLVVTPFTNLQFYINLSRLIFQTECCRLHFVFVTAGRVHISAHHAVGGCVASPPCSYLLRSGSRIWFIDLTPAWNIKHQTGWVHRGCWETKVGRKCVRERLKRTQY